LRAKRPRKGKVVSFDEKGTIAVKQYGGKVYAESVPKIEAKQNTRGLFEMVCAYDIHTHEVMHEFYDHKTHVEVVDALTKLKQRNKHYRLYVILDCWSAHVTKKLPALLKKQTVELVYLPTNASWMNDVERVFADIEKNVLANSNSPTKEHLQGRITNYFGIEYPKKI
jgi:transposase